MVRESSIASRIDRPLAPTAAPGFHPGSARPLCGQSSRCWYALMAACVLLTLRGTALAHPGPHHEIELVTAKLKSSPDDVRLLVQRGFLYRLEDNLDASLRDLDRALALAPNDASAGMQRGLTLSAMGRDKDAEKQLTRVAVSTESSVVYSERGKIRARHGRREEAIADFDKALALDPDVDLYLERARLLESIGRLDDASSGLYDALKELGPAVVLIDAAIDIEIKRQRFDSALKLIDEQIARLPVRTEWYLRRARVLEISGRAADAAADRKKALADAERMVRLKPVGTSFCARAKVFIALGRLEDARSDLNRALTKSPRYRDAQQLLASIHPPEGPAPLTSSREEGKSNAP